MFLVAVHHDGGEVPRLSVRRVGDGLRPVDDLHVGEPDPDGSAPSP
jgi:hypothetical protein